jgi:hypothetical protein
VEQEPSPGANAESFQEVPRTVLVKDSVERSPVFGRKHDVAFSLGSVSPIENLSESPPRLRYVHYGSTRMWLGKQRSEFFCNADVPSLAFDGR